MNKQKLPSSKHKLLLIGLVVALVVLIPFVSAFAAGVFDLTTLFQPDYDSKTYSPYKVEVERTEERDAVSYTITYHPNGANGSSYTDSGLENSEYTIMSPDAAGVGSKYAYAFVGWNTKPDGFGTSYLANQKIVLTQDLVLYARWEQKI